MLDKIKAKLMNKFFVAGAVLWVAGIGYAVSLGFEMLIPIAMIFAGDFLYDMSKGD